MENKKNRTGLVIMASGLSKRFGKNKLMEPLLEKPLISWVLDTTEGLFDRRVVVTRNEDVRALCEEKGISCIFHALPNRNDTVRLGLQALSSDADYCFFMPGDQPLMKKETFLQLIRAAEENNGKIIRPVFQAQVGSPVGFPSVYFDELLQLPEGKGGNVVVKKHPEAVLTVPVCSENELRDADTPEDFQVIRMLAASDAG